MKSPRRRLHDGDTFERFLAAHTIHKRCFNYFLYDPSSFLYYSNLDYIAYIMIAILSRVSIKNPFTLKDSSSTQRRKIRSFWAYTIGEKLGAGRYRSFGRWSNRFFKTIFFETKRPSQSWLPVMCADR